MLSVLSRNPSHDQISKRRRVDLPQRKRRCGHQRKNSCEFLLRGCALCWVALILFFGRRGLNGGLSPIYFYFLIFHMRLLLAGMIIRGPCFLMQLQLVLRFTTDIGSRPLLERAMEGQLYLLKLSVLMYMRTTPLFTRPDVKRCMAGFTLSSMTNTICYIFLQEGIVLVR